MTTEVDNYNISLQANIAIKLLVNVVAITQNSKILKDKQWFIYFYTSWRIIFDKHIFVSII